MSQLTSSLQNFAIPSPLEDFLKSFSPNASSVGIKGGEKNVSKFGGTIVKMPHVKADYVTVMRQKLSKF